jgi:PAS domain S-box-containing protein
VAKRAEMEIERIGNEKQLQAQNQALIEANRELARTRQALLEANHTLELRVEERTRELSASEEELRQSLEQLSEINHTLSEREAFLASIVNQTSVGIAVVSQEGRFVFVNNGYCKIVGWLESQLLTKSLKDITYPEDQKANVLLLKKLNQTKQWFETEKRYVRPDGSLVWCLLSVSSVKLEEGMPPRIMAVCQDISARKQSEIALLQTEERFKLLAKATNDTVWDWDLSTNLIWWNEGFRTMFGYSIEDIEPGIESWYSRIHPEDQKRIVDGIHQIIDYGGKQWKDEYRFRKADGSYAYILDRAYALHNENGKPYRMIGSMLDLTERKQADLALNRLTREYQFLINAVPTMIWRTSPSGELNYFNERWYNFTGYSPEQSLYKGWTSVLHPDDHDRTLRLWQQALVTHERFQIEYRLRKADGTYQWFLGQALPLINEKGDVTQWFGTCADIHAQKKAEEALLLSRLQEQVARANVEQQRLFLYLLLSQIPAIISVVKGPDLIYELANESLRKIAGEREYLGKSLKEAFPEIEPDLYALYQRVFQTGERYVGESFPIRLDWDTNNKPYIKYFDFVYEPFRDEQGKVNGVISFGYEVTNQVLARQVLEKSEAQIRLILESIPHLAWTSMPQTPINYFNKRWYEFTGLSEEQSLTYGWQTVVHPDDLPIVIERRDIGRSKGVPFEIENRYRRASDGSYRWHLARIVPIRDETGEITLWVGTATDIHEQKAAQLALEHTLKELHEKNFELDQFVYRTSHDLRAPLTTIMGLVTLLKKENNEATKSHYVDLIENRVQKLDMFIKSMLDYSRNTRTSTRFEVINLETLLQECIGELEYMRNFERLNIDLQIEERKIYSDAFRLKIIFSNLISNAIKYLDPTKEKSLLTIEVKLEADQMVIRFTDNGTGIAEEYQERIFNMFYRATDQSEGSGLGLYIVKQAATVLNGSIHLKSEAGKGTQFIVTLPKSTIPAENHHLTIE